MKKKNLIKKRRTLIRRKKKRSYNSSNEQSHTVSHVNVKTDEHASDLNEHHRKRNRHKKLSIYWAKCCPCCNFLRLVLCIFGTVIYGIAIAALLIGLLTKQQQTTTSTTTTTTQTTATTTTSTTTTTTATTTTTTRMTIITTTNENIYGIWNTSAGGDSTPSTSGTTDMGNFFPGETPENVFDNTTSTKYTNFGGCVFSISSTYSIYCGEHTGFYFTAKQGSSLLLSVQFCTGNDIPERDPFTITIEGSNASPSSLTLGSSWTLIYSGTTDLQSILSRYTCGTTQPIINNSIWYTRYRILVTSKRGNQAGTQYSEVILVGYI